MKKILVVTLSNIGDVVLTLPVFQSLIASFPGAKIHAVAGESSKIVFEKDARIQKLFVYNRRGTFREKFAFLSEIRKERYDLIIDLRYSLMGLLGGGRCHNPYILRSHAKHKGRRHEEVLTRLGVPILEGTSFLKFTSAQALVGGEGSYVAVAPGSKSDIKKWPVEYFSKLLDRLAVEGRQRIVLVGDQKDVKGCEKIKSLMTSSVVDLSGKTNFHELCSVLKSAKLVITSDSAPLHIADSYRTPVLALFGPTDPLKYGPRNPTSAAMHREIFCSPCEKPQCRFKHECMKELGVDEVTTKAFRLLKDESSGKKPKILIIRLDRLGDMMLSMPAIQAVREYFPESFISVLTRPSTAAILEGHPAIDEVIPYFYEKKGRHHSFSGNFRFLIEILRRRFDICFILHPSVRSHLVPFVTGIPTRIGFGSVLPFFLTKSVKDLRHLGLKHESEYTLDVVRAFGVKDPVKNVSGVRFFWEHEKKMKRPTGQRVVAIHPGSSCPSKKWPVERYAELIKMILQNTLCQIVVVGGGEEKTLGEILKREDPARVSDLTDKLDLKELAAFFSECEVLISNDSGPVHVAAAVGTRTLVIFGRNKAGLNRERWKALGEKHRTLQKNVGCAVCLADACTIDFECLKAVSAEEVYRLFREMIQLNPPPVESP